MLLDKKVHAINEVQRLSVLNFSHILPQLKEFEGQKIILMSGNKSAKFKNAISFLTDEPKGFKDDYARLHWCMLDISSYSVWIKVSCSFKDSDSSCFYEEQSIYIGKMENGVLTEVVDNVAPEFDVYKVGEIRSLMNEKKRIEDELSAIKSKLRKFDGYYS